jgi:acyl-CoA thioester hydrolase
MPRTHGLSERGRTNHLRLLGAEQYALFAEAQAETRGFAFVVRSMEVIGGR